MNGSISNFTPYMRDIVEHLLFGLTRARMFDEAVAGKPWNADLTKGAVEIGQRIFEAQILGTFAPGSRSFLWAWANPGNAKWSASLFAANEAKKRGQLPGYAMFGEREIFETRANPREIATVTGELTGGHPVYAPLANGTTIFFLIAAPLDPRAVPTPFLPGILLDFQSLVSAHREACVARFFERLGFQTARSAAETVGVRADGTRIHVAWDAQERITNVSLRTAGE
jgi:hypothetical protein